MYLKCKSHVAVPTISDSTMLEAQGSVGIRQARSVESEAKGRSG